MAPEIMNQAAILDEETVKYINFVAINIIK